MYGWFNMHVLVNVFQDNQLEISFIILPLWLHNINPNRKSNYGIYSTLFHPNILAYPYVAVETRWNDAC